MSITTISKTYPTGKPGVKGLAAFAMGILLSAGISTGAVAGPAMSPQMQTMSNMARSGVGAFGQVAGNSACGQACGQGFKAAGTKVYDLSQGFTAYASPKIQNFGRSLACPGRGNSGIAGTTPQRC